MSSFNRKLHRRQAFSLIELVIVVVIIAIIGAIAIPRMSRGAAGAADSAVTGDLNILRSAIDLYASEHDGNYPTSTNFTAALTEFSDESGTTNATKDASTGKIYGPYLRAVPALPVGANKGSTGIVDSSAGSIGVNAGGWYYDATSGNIHTNTTNTEVDDAGNPFNSY